LPPHAGLGTDRSQDPTPAWTPIVGAGSHDSHSTFAPPHVSDWNPAPPDVAPHTPLVETARRTDVVSGAAIDGASMRYWRPADGTLQFLPGRLEVIAGRDAGQDIRFVRTPGPDGTCVTFGRAEGAPYRHVQLREPTVSRSHARMTLDTPVDARTASMPTPDSGGAPRWHLENLSTTNPVVVNGRPLAADGGSGSSVCLAEGDRIEMGEVVFRFHER
jgi:hypothetical protein